MKLSPSIKLFVFGSFLVISIFLLGGADYREDVVDHVLDSKPNFMFCGFTSDSSLDRFAIAVSSDGAAWNRIPDAKWNSPTKYVNAPTCLMHNQSWFVHASASNDKSGDIPNWYIGKMSGLSVQTVADVDWRSKITGLRACFSGEWFVDSSVHLFIPCTTDASLTSGWKTYETHPLDSDFKSWSDPLEVHLNQDNVYDSTVFKFETTYYMWLTEITGSRGNFRQSIHLAKSSALLGPYRVITSGDWAHWYAALGPHEAPTPYRTPSGWRLAMERLEDHRMYYSDCGSQDMGNCSWSALHPWKEDRIYRHGTVRPLTGRTLF